MTFIRYIVVYFTFGIPDCVHYNEDLVISRFSSIPFANFGRAEEYRSLYRGFRYIEVR